MVTYQAHDMVLSTSGPDRRRGASVKVIRVVIADDSPAALDGLRGILRVHADIVVGGEAVDGVEAVDRAEALKPDVVLVDSQMPEMDGVEATRRREELVPDTKVLFLSVHTAHIDDALDAGVDGFLLKDSGREVLIDAIRRLVQSQPDA